MSDLAVTLAARMADVAAARAALHAAVGALESVLAASAGNSTSGATPSASDKLRTVRHVGLRTRPVSMELMTSCGMPDDDAN